MARGEDARLWAHVRRGVIPLGEPCPGERPLDAVRPPGGIDLHGDTVQRAYERVRETVAEARAAGRRELVVVTGRSGRINAEFPVWAARDPDVRALEPLRGGGAYRIRLRKARDAGMAPGR